MPPNGLSLRSSLGARGRACCGFPAPEGAVQDPTLDKRAREGAPSECRQREKRALLPRSLSVRVPSIFACGVPPPREETEFARKEGTRQEARREEDHPQAE